MIKIKQILVSAALFAGLCSALHADVVISVSADKNKIDLNDNIRLNVSVEGSGNVPQPQMPDLSAFNVYSSGRSQNISFINGKMSSSIVYNYNLMPKSTGKFTIGAFSVTVDGKTAQSQPLEIEVVPAGSSPPQSSKPAGRTNAPGAFVKLLASRSKVFLNEQVILRFKFYFRVNLLANPQYQPPEFKGFIAEDLPPKNFTETVNGVGYRVLEIQTALFPAKTGKILIPPAQINIAVQDVSQASQDDVFGMFFGGGAREYVLKTDPVELDVMPLPSDGKPAGFSGGVGAFNLAASLDKPKSAVGEAITMTVTVSGEGNVKSLGDPVFPDFPGFRKFDTASSLNIEKANEKVQGSKVYKIVLIPQSSGKQTLPSVTFTYFSLAEKKYKTLKSAPISVDVSPGSPSDAPKYVGNYKSPDIQMLQEEIRFIKLKNNSKKPFTWIHKSKYFLALNIFSVAILCAALIYRLRNILSALNPEKRRKSRALQNALAELKRDRPMDAMQGFFADKMLVPPQGLTQKQAEDFLAKSKLDAETVSQAKALWNDLDLLHYAPSHFEKSGQSELSERVKNLLKKIEKSLPLFACILLGSALAFVQETQDPFSLGNQFYQEGKYSEAVEQYGQYLAVVGENPVTEYNLGNAYFKQGAHGEAILHWARAFRMGLTDSDVRYNLQFASVRAGDPFFSDIAPVRWIYILTHFFSINVFSIAWILSLWSAGLCFSFMLFKKISLKNAVSVSLIFILFVSGIFMAGRLYEEEWNCMAVVTGQKAEVRSGPGAQFSVGFTVPEGRRVFLMEETFSKDWVQVAVPKEGLKGWVSSQTVKKI